MFMSSLFLIFPKKVELFASENNTKFQNNNSIEIHFVNEMFRSLLLSLIVKNANQNNFANNNDLKVLNNDS